MERREKFVSGEYYHVFNRSIEKFKIFDSPRDFQRMVYLIRYYQLKGNKESFSCFSRFKEVRNSGLDRRLVSLKKEMLKCVEILSYCIMPTHIHLVIKQIDEGGISLFMRNILNGYAQYFNKKYNRNGPLWTGRFKAEHVETDEQLVHLTRYVHLNPTTAGLVKNPEDWRYSSYFEYIGICEEDKSVCDWHDVIDIEKSWYKSFVEKHKVYQKELAVIKREISTGC
ncbi:hypothetical protein MNBD_UNCLBAC01-946 [hydrothermal vent metagenome]|uniref:Transposase IS200-like domain-containing protein n=1 Tax=hydrothermal vent metagenome TaxID=652676 RepID=A0A3B1DJM0_9ZZZZ